MLVTSRRPAASPSLALASPPAGRRAPPFPADAAALHRRSSYPSSPPRATSPARPAAGPPAGRWRPRRHRLRRSRPGARPRRHPIRCRRARELHTACTRRRGGASRRSPVPWSATTSTRCPWRAATSTTSTAPDRLNGPAGDRRRGYYCFDLGAWNVVVLNTNCRQVGGCHAGSPQEQSACAWTCSPATRGARSPSFHHPLFASGPNGNYPQMPALWQALYDFDADVVLSGHEHLYERYAPQTPQGVADPARGIRQFVVGTGGHSLTRFRDHPAQQRGAEQPGLRGPEDGAGPRDRVHLGVLARGRRPLHRLRLGQPLSLAAAPGRARRLRSRRSPMVTVPAFDHHRHPPRAFRCAAASRRGRRRTS